MTGSLYVHSLDMASGALLLAGVLVLWRRDLAAIVRLFAVQGAALAALVAVLGLHEGHAGTIALAAGIGVPRGVVLPMTLPRAVRAGRAIREPVALGAAASALVGARWSRSPRPRPAAPCRSRSRWCCSASSCWSPAAAPCPRWRGS